MARNRADVAASKALEEVQRLTSLKRHPEALERCSEIIQRYPKLFEAYFRRAHVHVVMGNVHEGLEDLAHAIKLNPREPALFFFQGLWLLRMKQYNAAVDALSEALHLEQALNSKYYAETAQLAQAVAYLLASDFDHASSAVKNVSEEAGVFVAGKVWTAASIKEEITRQRGANGPN
jgi:tetratricopeptide (TPR) repeat protein